MDLSNPKAIEELKEMQGEMIANDKIMDDMNKPFEQKLEEEEKRELEKAEIEEANPLTGYPYAAEVAAVTSNPSGSS